MILKRNENLPISIKYFKIKKIFFFENRIISYRLMNMLIQLYLKLKFNCSLKNELYDNDNFLML